MTNEASLEVEFSVQVNQSQADVSSQGSPSWKAFHPLKASSSSLCCTYFPNLHLLPSCGRALTPDLLSVEGWRMGHHRAGQGHLSSLLPQCSRQQVKTWGGHHQVLRSWSPTPHNHWSWARNSHQEVLSRTDPVSSRAGVPCPPKWEHAPKGQVSQKKGEKGRQMVIRIKQKICLKMKQNPQLI